MSMDELANYLRIECEFRLQEEQEEHTSKVNMVEYGSSFKPSKDKKKRPHGDNKKEFKGVCWQCNKPSHTEECSIWKRKKGQKNQGGTKDNFVSTISEINVMESDNSWWVDSSATKHVCKDRTLIQSFKPLDDGTYNGLAFGEEGEISKQSSLNIGLALGEEWEMSKQSST